MDEQTKALRAVIEAARSWAHETDRDALEDAAEKLQDAVTALDTHLKKAASGFVVRRTWGTILAGHWVKTPTGEWWEVKGVTSQEGKTLVSLFMPDGKIAGPFPRDPAGEVIVRLRSKLIVEDEAVQLLSAAFDATVMESPPWEQ
jgi:hypothetical protein